MRTSPESLKNKAIAMIYAQNPATSKQCKHIHRGIWYGALFSAVATVQREITLKRKLYHA